MKKIVMIILISSTMILACSGHSDRNDDVFNSPQIVDAGIDEGSSK